ncbi:hypothetical protein T492DRAFT_874414 [Pavlovales sp. CCMP2436]|nr:hypothetical protein T492DRAFT_874414 [Pavlovales sp. CCMP2436]
MHSLSLLLNKLAESETVNTTLSDLVTRGQGIKIFSYIAQLEEVGEEDLGEEDEAEDEDEADEEDESDEEEEELDESHDDIGDDSPSAISAAKKSSVQAFLNLGAPTSSKLCAHFTTLCNASGKWAFQSSTIIETLYHWKQVDDGLLPTGTGKSRVISTTSAIMALRFEQLLPTRGTAAPKVLVVSPNKAINRGLRVELEKSMGVAWAKCSRGLFVLKSRKMIRSKKYADAGVVLTNYHVLAQGQADVLTLNQRADVGRFDVIIFDEGHHRAAASYQRILTDFTPKFTLLLSACFLRNDRQKVPLTPVFRRHLPWAVENQLVVRPFVKNLVIENLTVHKLVDGQEVDVEELTDEQVGSKSVNVRALIKNPLLHEHIAQSMARELVKLRQETGCSKLVGLAKASSKAHAKKLVKVYKDIVYKALAPGGTVGREVERKDEKCLDLFERGHIDVLVVVGMLSKSYDHTWIAVLAWHCPTTSIISALQFLGRALRWMENVTTDKQVCMTVVPKAFGMDGLCRSIHETIDIREETSNAAAPPQPGARVTKRGRSVGAPVGKPANELISSMAQHVVETLDGHQASSSSLAAALAPEVPLLDERPAQPRQRALLPREYSSTRWCGEVHIPVPTKLAAQSTAVATAAEAAAQPATKPGAQL